MADSDVTHARTGVVTPPAFPYEVHDRVPAEAARREQLARWITSKENPYFARSYVNLFDENSGASDSRPDDESPRDRVGHGTAVAMAAAGVTNSGPSDTITGGSIARSAVDILGRARNASIAYSGLGSVELDTGALLNFVFVESTATASWPKK